MNEKLINDNSPKLLEDAFKEFLDYCDDCSLAAVSVMLLCIGLESSCPKTIATTQRLIGAIFDSNKRPNQGMLDVILDEDKIFQITKLDCPKIQ